MSNDHKAQVDAYPCPFCGGSVDEHDKINGKHFRFCWHCNAAGPQADSSEEALKLWERRAVLPASAPPAPAASEPVMCAVAQVIEADHDELEARIRWLLNPLPVGAVLYEETIMVSEPPAASEPATWPKWFVDAMAVHNYEKLALKSPATSEPKYRSQLITAMCMRWSGADKIEAGDAVEFVLAFRPVSPDGTQPPAASSDALDARQWHPMTTAPKDGLIDIWAFGRRYIGCYRDHICNEYRTIDTSGTLIRLRDAEFWMSPPQAPDAAIKGEQHDR